MPKIKPLSEYVISKIAAGEVIERPAYAVKELIENSLDAGADSINISVLQSGLKKITVSDNGEGMDKADILECFKPHTTSKITDEDTLLGIQSLGFRGEALSSISAISSVTIKSRTSMEPGGIQVQLYAGEVQNILPIGMPVGTSVTVENLFGSVPVRKNFLKSPKTEFRHIVDVVVHAALAFPNVRFLLSHNKRIVLDLPKTDDIATRVYSLFGKELFDHLVPLTFEDSYVTISGFVGKPHITTGQNQKQYTFINNRKVTDKLVASAVKEAYGSLLDLSSYPVFVLFISLPFEIVDINIHPRKETVSFINSKLVFDAVKEAVTKVLLENNLTLSNISWQKDDLKSITKSYAGKLLKQLVTKKEQKTEIVKLSDIVQLHNLYLVVQTKNGVLFIDQHAAHERILFEKFHSEFLKQKKKSKKLKLKKPLILTFSLNEYQILLEEKKYFVKLGFTFKKANKNSIILLTVSHLLQDRNPQELISELITDLYRDQRLTTNDHMDQQSYKMLCYLACRGAIKAGDKQTKEQMKKLIKDLEKTPNNYTCPHGRPTRIEMPLLEINKYFKR